MELCPQTDANRLLIAAPLPPRLRPSLQKLGPFALNTLQNTPCSLVPVIPHSKHKEKTPPHTNSPPARAVPYHGQSIAGPHTHTPASETRTPHAAHMLQNTPPAPPSPSYTHIAQRRTPHLHIPHAQAAPKSWERGR